MKLEFFEEQIFFATVRLALTEEDGASSVGTGFLLNADLTDDKGVVLLISNRHVLPDPAGRITADFHRRDPSNPNRPLLGEVVHTDQIDFSGVYYGHPDPEIDLACLNVSPIADPSSGIYYKALGLELFASFDERELVAGRDVWFVGYPENRFDAAHNLPILRTGAIASIPVVDFNARPQFVVDAQAFPGSSGSPVFTLIEGKYKFIGVLTETMIRNQLLEAMPTRLFPSVPQLLGLGIVLKARLVRELVEHALGEVRKGLGGAADAAQPELADAQEVA